MLKTRQEWQEKIDGIWNDIIPVLWAHDMLQDWQEEVAALQAENKKLFNENCELQENRSKSNLIAQRREEVIQNLNKEIDRLTACVEPVNYPVYDKIDLIEKIAELEKTSPMHPIYTDDTNPKKWDDMVNKTYHCNLCHDTGYYGDTGPGRRNSDEIVMCDCKAGKNVPVGVSDPQK
jgi:hypothetical protein